MKKLHKKTTVAVIAALCFTSLFTLFNSCEVGLGAAVDVEPPSLVIDSPEVDSVIRDVFAIKGRWSDDGSVDKVKVTLSRTDGYGKDVTINGEWSVDEELKETGTWQAIVDYKKHKLIDGTYLVTASIKDKGNHETTQSTTITLDNTAPVLILNKPNSAPDETPSVYGQRLYLQGNIADTAKQTFIEVDFFQDEACTIPVHTITTDPISPTDVNSNNAKLATFLDLDYDTIYGTTDLDPEDIAGRKKGSKPLYIKFKVYDNAIRLPVYENEELDGKKGNETEIVYFSRDLSDSLTKRKAAGGYGLAPIDIYSIVSGTEALKDTTARSVSDSDIKSIVDILKTKEQTISYINIDPDNNPYFTISGLNTLSHNGTEFDDSDSGFQIKNGSQILEISVFMGNDSIELATKDEQHPLYVYLLECDENGNPKKEDKEENRIKLYSKVKDVEITTDGKKEKYTVYAIGGKQGHKTTDGAYVFSIPVSKSIKSWSETENQITTIDVSLVYGTNYLVKVNGVDNEGNPIVANGTGYGFKFMSNDSAPTLTITEPDKPQVYKKVGSEFEIKGTVKSLEGIPSVQIFLDNVLLGNADFKTQNEGEANEFSYKLTADKFDQNNSKQYLVRITATRGTAPTSVEKTVYYDVDGPEITIISEEPVIQKTVNGETKRCTNGIIKIKGSVSDDFDRFGEAHYEVKKPDGTVLIQKSAATALTERFNFEINTLDNVFENINDIKVVITASDRAGNETETVLDYYIDQETDRPQIINSAEDVDFSADVDSVINGEWNMFTKTSTLYLNVDDDDGLVKNTTVTLRQYDTVEGTTGDILVDYTKQFPKQSAAPYQFPDEAGIFFVTVRSEDTNYVSDEATPYSFNVQEFYVRLTGNGPDVTIVPTTEYVSTKGKPGVLELTFNVTDEGNGPYSLTVVHKNADGTDRIENVKWQGTDNENNPIELTTQPSGFKYQKIYEADSNPTSDEIKLIIRDKTAVKTEKKYSVKFDHVSPTISFDAKGYPALGDTDGETFYFKGSVEDTGTSPSGVSNVQIIFKDGEVSALPAADDTGWITATSTLSTWNYLVTWKGTGNDTGDNNKIKAVFLENGKPKEGKKTVFVKAYDKAENQNETVTKQIFTYDVSAPEIASVTGDAYTNKKSIDLEIKVADTNPTLPTVVLYKGDVKDENKLENTQTKTYVSVIKVGDTADANGYFTYKATITFPVKDSSKPEDEQEPVNGTYNVTIQGNDVSGRTGNTTTFRTVCDTEKPTIDNVSLTEGTKDPNNANVYVYKKTYSKDSKYYTNNTNKTYRISGVSVDKVGIDTVGVTLTNTATTNTATLIELEASADSDTGVWTYSIPQNKLTDFQAWKTGALATITVKDIAGNIQTKTLDIEFDVTGPQGVHEIDANAKDLYFRIGNSDNDDITESTAGKYGLTWNNGSTTNKIDEDVGGKYSNGTYGNDLTIEIRGKFNDSGSGVKKIYYQVRSSEFEFENSDDDEAKETELKNLAKAIVNNTVTGYTTRAFEPLETSETKRVFYTGKENTDGTYDGTVGGTITGGTQLVLQSQPNANPPVQEKSTKKFYKEIETTYKASISGFSSEHPNYLILVAEDNAGNYAVDVARNIPYKDAQGNVQTGDFVNYSLNVDTDVPEINSETNDIIYTNKEGYIELYGTVNDTGAGIRSLTFKLNNDSLDVYSGEEGDTVPTDLSTITKCVVTTSTTSGKTLGPNNEKQYNDWNIKIPASKFENDGKTYTVYATAKDNAGIGNETKEAVGSIKVDTQRPEVTISTPADADNTESNGLQVNGKISLSGTAKDNSGGSGLKEDTASEKSITLYYTTNSTLGEKQAAQISASDITTETGTTAADSSFVKINTVKNNFTWTFDNIDTTKLGSSDTTTNAYFMVSTQDQAGNIGYSNPLPVIIDQDTDRPIITLTNITLATQGETSFLKKTSILEGTISDDDGNVTKFEYRKEGESAWTEKTLEYGTAWSIPGLAEGENTLYFRVTDTANAKPFVTAVIADNATDETPETSDQPKIKDYNNTFVTHTKGSLALNFKVVTEHPTVQDVIYSVHNNSTDAWEERTAIGTLGGVYDKFKISLRASAVAFIANVKATYNDEDYEFAKVVTQSGENFNDKNLHKWQSDEIELVEGKNKIVLVVADQSSTTDPMTTEQTISFGIDNTPPVITIKEPSGIVGVKETMQIEVNEGDTKVYYALTKPDVTTLSDSASAWTEIKDTSNGFRSYVYFDDDFSADDHTDRFALYLTEATTEKPKRLGITTLEEIERTTNPYEEITPVKFWAKAIDICGNVNTSNITVNVDPQGNRPSVSINYPIDILKKDSTTEYEHPVLGGTIRIDGNVTDDIAAKYAWVQIVRDGETFNATELKFLSSKGYPIGNMTTNEVVSAATVQALANNADVSDYAIRVPVSGTAWNLSINGNLEFNKIKDESNDSTTTVCKLIMYATDADPDKVNAGRYNIHRSAPITQYFSIDSANPYINMQTLKLVKYESEAATDPVSEKEFKDLTSIEGIWYLQGIIADDDSGIKTISYKFESDAAFTNIIEASGNEATSIGNKNHFFFKKVAHGTQGDDANKFNYEFSIPLGNSDAGRVGTDKITIRAVENTTQNLFVEQSYTVIYDNKAPEFNQDSGNSFVKLDNNIQNSNGFYTFGAIACEDAVTIGETTVSQSGVERIAFYFTRDLEYSLSELENGTTLYPSHINEKDSKTNDIFDIMIYRDGNESNDIASGNMIVNYKGKTDNNELIYSEGLYWRRHSGSSSGKTFTYSGAKDNNIHSGGLIKIGGVIYKIKAVTNNTVEINSDIGTKADITADFALCNVIDNPGEKNGNATSNTHGYGFGYYGSRNTDDGDLITETFNNQGTEWIFDASINSRNLPDGPVTLHIIAFDKAGNYNIKIDPHTNQVVPDPLTLNGTVKNNAPRIAGLLIGTDENGNDKVDNGEYINAYSGKYAKGYDTSGNEKHDVEFPIVAADEEQTNLLTVKGLTIVKPEIIGGNGIITYGYELYTKNGNNWVKKEDATKAERDLKKASVTDLTVSTQDNITGTTDDVVTGWIELPVSDFIGTEDGVDSRIIPDGNNKFKFTLGDSTPGTTKENGIKNTATITVYLGVALREANAAKNWILPLYWNSSSDNSLFNQSRDNGHIELGTDWIKTTAFNDASNEEDADPKVSGKIKLEGIAYDDTLLRDIKVQFGTALGGLGTNNNVIAHYNETSGKWGTGSGQNFVEFAATEPTEIPDSGWTSYVKRATYNELVKVGLIPASKITDDEAQIGTIVNGVKKEYLSTALVPETSQELGHVVHWILYLDTSKIQNIAATNVTITATALDRGTPTWNATDNKVNYSANAAAITVTNNNTGFSGAVTKAGNNISVADMTGKYRIDVVPYITGIETSLYKSLKSSIRTAYSRTALGHYIARLDEAGTPDEKKEKIIIKGFNLTGGTVTFTPDTEGSTANKTYNETGISVPSNAKSGVITMVVNDVEILNNKNNNNACGSYSQGITESSSYTDKDTYAYNRMPNRTSNNLLTDDVYIDIWEFDSDAAKPRSGELREPSMQINPVTGKVGLAFVSGPGDFAMAGGTNGNDNAASNSDPTKDIYSYNLWQNNYATFNNIAFVYDSNGFAHATATGLDTNPGSGSLHAGRFSYFYNRWGRSGTGTTGNYDGLNAVRLESIAVPNWTKTTRDFEPTYLRNKNGEVPTETVKKLLIKGVVPETTSLTETRFYSPSLAATVHGSGDSATTAVYLAYYDSVQGQIRFRYTDEMPQTWDSTLTYENLIVDKTTNPWSVVTDSTYKEEYVTGSTLKIENGIPTGDGGFVNLHHGKNNADDFVDNLGYFIKPNDWEAYMEANTDHFSLIAGVDYQGGEDDITTTSYNVNVNKTDEEGNVLYTTVYRRALTQTQGDSIVLDQNKKDPYEIKTKKLSNNDIKLLHADLKGQFNTTDAISYIYNTKNTKYWWIIHKDTNTEDGITGLIYMGTKDSNNPDAQGRYTHKLKIAAETTDLEGFYLNGEYDVYEKISSIEEDDPDYYIVDTSAPEFFIPYHNKTISVAVPITKKEVIKTGYDTGYTAYKYVAIDANTDTQTGNDVVVAVWFDGTNCCYAYNTNPTSGLDNGAAGGWDGNKVIFSEGGEYCTVKFDPDGGVHIAAYVDGSLRYAYLSSYDARYNEATDSVRVDSFTITGERINLDVGKEKVGNTDDYVVVPYITYFNGTARKPTVAKLVIPENGVMNYKAQGTDDSDVFTGNWEITLVPSSSTLTTNYYDKMNIALWKWEGKIVKSNDSNFGTIVTAKTSADNTSNGTRGDIYGNGTANPILGYAVESTSGTYLETAQMK